jgi:hypothetical protein
MVQLPLPLFQDIINEVVVVKKREVRKAWVWLLRNMSPRPDQNSGLCVYDLKVWGGADAQQPLSPTHLIGTMLGHLYLTSELGDLGAIINMVNGADAQDVIVPAGNLDEDVKNVIISRKRFRDGLSEHLAFWVCLATAAQLCNDGSRFACILPHVQAEDKGPDGLFLLVGLTNKVELQSVKNSGKDPLYLLSTRSFQKGGRVSSSARKRLLEEFYKFAYQRSGFTRLDRALSDLCKHLDVQADQKIRMALLSNTLCSYNAIVVADHQYAKQDLFKGYQYITQDVERRIATYIGSTSWAKVAEIVRRSVLQILKRSGLL